MTRNVLELSLSVFLLVLSATLVVCLMGGTKPLGECRALIAETWATQDAFVASTAEAQELVTEVGYALVTDAMAEERMVPPAEANQMIEESLAKVDEISPRFGKLARIVNNRRIHESMR